MPNPQLVKAKQTLLFKHWKRTMCFRSRCLKAYTVPFTVLHAQSKLKTQYFGLDEKQYLQQNLYF